jgi:hypothetical protein
MAAGSSAANRPEINIDNVQTFSRNSTGTTMTKIPGPAQVKDLNYQYLPSKTVHNPAAYLAKSATRSARVRRKLDCLRVPAYLLSVKMSLTFSTGNRCSTLLDCDSIGSGPSMFPCPVIIISL